MTSNKHSSGKALCKGLTEATVLSENANPNELYGKSLAKVFKEHLPHISECYRARPYEEVHDNSNPAESVASFDITKLVIDKSGNAIDKLKNVYHMLAYSEDSIALIIKRTAKRCDLTVAVGAARRDSEGAINLAAGVRDAFLGSFPGSECTEIAPYSDSIDGAFYPLNKAANFGGGNFNSVGIVSNVATDFSEAFVAQGVEKLIDGMMLEDDEEFSVVLLATSVAPQSLMQKKNELYELYTALSPFERVQRSWGEQESTTWTKSLNIGLFATTPDMGTTPNPRLGASIGGGFSHGSTKGTTQQDTVTITEYGVAHTLETIRGQMERIEQCEALGLWQFSAYIMSSDYRLVSEASRMYLSLTQGKGSFYERPAINIWNARSNNGARQSEIEEIRKYLAHLEHPQFEMVSAKLNSNFNQANWPVQTLCVSEVSGSELTRAMNLPTSSIPGLPVIACAPFGREVSSYDQMLQGDVRIGRIHHMHRDEKTSVDLSSESLVSHAFVTGSTGSGKSNTVYRLLEEACCNFLVIEPAKGEYKDAIGAGANYFGTNYMMGEILRVNPFVFPQGVHVYEHIDRILEVFNVCWPMYAAMPAVLKESVIRAYEKVGWDLKGSRNSLGDFYPTFKDVCDEIDRVIDSSDYSDENKGNYRGSLKTRLQSLTNGINGTIFCEGSISDEMLFDSKTIVDLSRVGSSENKALIMGILVIKLQERRMSQRGRLSNEGLKHLVVLEEAHNLLRNHASATSPEMGGGLAAKSVEMLANSIAEMRTYGEGFVIVDQAPGLIDMSAIRNTNTKIIMRLPDQSDRELVGRAANLNDDQIAELARLQRGVAAVYQNEWVEPVLCRITKHEDRPYGGDQLAKQSGRAGITDEEARYINSCIYDPYFLTKPSDISFIDCITKLEVADSTKALMAEYANTRPNDRKELFQRLAFSYFGIDGLVSGNVDGGNGSWAQILREYMDGVEFADGTDVDFDGEVWQRFSKMMLAQSVMWIDENSRDPEKSQIIEAIWKLGTM